MEHQRRFEADTLHAALDRVHDELGPDVRIVSAERVRRGGLGGFFSRESFEVVVEQDTAPVSLVDLADAVSDIESAQPTLSTERAEFADVLARISREVEPAPEPAPEPFVPLPVVAVETLPQPVEPEDDRHPRIAALEDALADLPSIPPVPQGVGSVVAVVGDRDDALAFARTFASEVALASPAYKGKQIPPYLQIPSRTIAEEQRRSWRRRTEPTVVVIDVPVGSRLAEWGCDILAALEPALTWGVVDATRKNEDVAWWMEQLGGVDALVLRRVDETITPESLLRLGIPVGWMDGEEATGECWSGVVTRCIGA